MTNRPLFRDRTQAGRNLAESLARFRGPDTVVLGLPRGGIPVAFEVARALGAPLDVCVVRKLCPPSHPDLGVGAVAEGGALFVRHNLATAYGLHDEQLQEAIRQKRSEVAERVGLLRQGAEPVELRGKTVLVVDDGVASGSTAHAALRCLRQRGATRLVFAVPIGPAQELADLAHVADEVICLHPKADFVALALGYEDFTPVDDAQVIELLQRAATERPSQRTPPRVATALS